MKLLLVVIFMALLGAGCFPAEAIEINDANQPDEESHNTATHISPTQTPPPTQMPTSTYEPTAQETIIPAQNFTPTTEAVETPSPAPTEIPPALNTPEVEQTDEVVKRIGKAIIVDHTSIELFEQIPEEYLEAARNLNMLFADRSVGQNIDAALNCLTAEAWHLTRAYCRRDFYDTSSSQWLFKTYNLEDYRSGSVPATILYEPDPVKYDRSNWTFDIAEGDWENIIRMFIEDLIPEYIETKDVLSFQFNYFNISQGSNIADPETGFFAEQPHEDYYLNRLRWDIGNLEELEAKYPDKIFFYWTTSLSRSTGSAVGEAFNNQLREYVLANDKYLFDVADILSHDPEGNPCYDNRDGIEYCNNNRCENHPDDGKNYPAICQAYTTETDGGHLGAVSGGGIRVAKAFWVLMAKIAGWEG